MTLRELRGKYSILTSGYFVKPQKLYHYTSPEGLKGILTNRSLFFTDSQFLNDKNECRDIYCFLKMAIKEVGAAKNQELFSAIKEFALDAEKTPEYLGSEIQNTSIFRFFVASFCLDSDNLSMWNYYTKTPNSYGYNICFDWHMLQRAIWDNELLRELSPVNNYGDGGFEVPYFNMYGSVIYDDEAKIKILTELIHDILNCEEETIFPQNPMEIFEKLIRGLGLFFKNKAFTNEKEYRFVIVSRNKELCDYEQKHPDSDLYDYRLMNGILLPYVNAPILCPGSVEKVVVSPGVQQEIAIQGLEYFMFHNGYCPRVEKSDIPLRY